MPIAHQSRRAVAGRALPAEWRLMAQSVSSARSVSRSGQRRITDVPARMSAHRHIPDPVQRDAKCALMTQPGHLSLFLDAESPTRNSANENKTLRYGRFCYRGAPHQHWRSFSIPCVMQHKPARIISY